MKKEKRQRKMKKRSPDMAPPVVFIGTPYLALCLDGLEAVYIYTIQILWRGDG